MWFSKNKKCHKNSPACGRAPSLDVQVRCGRLGAQRRTFCFSAGGSGRAIAWICLDRASLLP